GIDARRSSSAVQALDPSATTTTARRPISRRALRSVGTKTHLHRLIADLLRTILPEYCLHLFLRAGARRDEDAEPAGRERWIVNYLLRPVREPGVHEEADYRRERSQQDRELEA